MAGRASESSTPCLRLVLGDQLSHQLASLRDGDRSRDVVLLAEVWEEATYVAHHKKKIVFIFSAMRHFADNLREDGWQVDYIALDDPDNTGSLKGELGRALARHGLRRVVVTECGEYRLHSDMLDWRADLEIELEIRDDDRFLCSKAAFADWAEGRKALRMEYFYREMRRKTGLLMTAEGEPEGGDWNYDADNRKALPRDIRPTPPRQHEPDAITRAVLDLVADRFADHFGALEPFWFAVTSRDAKAAFTKFVAQGLPRFGDYQDAMAVGEPFLFHAVVGLYLNAGLLDPLEVCRQVEAAYYDGTVPLNAAEGFIRQIIGWREYVRGIYWLKMPDYAAANALDAKRRLPAFYWTGETDMRCLAEAIGQTRREAYAHHIQRLMVTGNFALLAGLDPAQVNEWYLIVYADAYEWVELPNVSGMTLFADGGVLASKPYAASGKYIDRMSNYCGQCRYDVKASTGADACPFNFLYWNFMADHRDRLKGNPRMAMMIRSLDRMAPDKVAGMRGQATAFLEKVCGDD